MVHVMKLKNDPFQKIKTGKKTVELRLYDNKRRQLDIGDDIIFTNLSYSPEIGWLVRHLDFDSEYRQTEIRDELKNYTASKTGPQNIANSYRRISQYVE